MRNRKQEGGTIEWKNTGSELVRGGELVLMDAAGVPWAIVPSDDALPSETVSARTEGVFELPKDGAAIAQGAAVYRGADGAVTDTAGEAYVGRAWYAAGADAPLVWVRINFARPSGSATPGGGA